MQDGYPLDFSNKTLAEFFEDEIGENLYDDKFSFKGTSKANRIRAFLEFSSARQAARLLKALWKHRNTERNAELHRRSELVAGGFEDVESLEIYCLQFASEDKEFDELISAIEQRGQTEVIDATTVLASSFDFDTVMDEIERARTFIEDDPEDAITAASSLIESVCRSILVELQLPLPKDLSIKPLYKAVRDPLGLSPENPDVDPLIAEDVRTILAGLTNTIGGIGSLRTHGGDAHGRERGKRRVDARIARLAVNSACALTLFLIEIWARKYPNRTLVNTSK
ncbi:abortive phage resistance protein [Leisingera sp. ANG59]|nr:abortive phage resistance protein [Leisingera sp. ANG59]